MNKWIIYSFAAVICVGSSLGVDAKQKTERDAKPVKEESEQRQNDGQNQRFLQKRPNQPVVGERRESVALPQKPSKDRRVQKPPKENQDNQDRHVNSGSFDRNDRNNHDRNDRNHNDRNRHDRDWGDRHDHDRNDRDHHDRYDRDRHDRYDRDRHDRYDRDRHDRYSSRWPVYSHRPVTRYPTVVYHRRPAVTVFDGFGWSGRHLELSAGSAISDLRRYGRSGYGSWDDCLSSIRIRGDVTVVLYTQPNFRGDRIYLHHDVRRFGGHSDLDYFLRRVSSIRVLHGRQYGHGYTTWISAGHHNRSAGIAVGLAMILDQLRDDRSNEVRKEEPSSYSEGYYESGPPMVTIYDQPYYRGNSVSLEPDEAIAFLSSIARGNDGTWDDKIASVRIQGGAALYVYSDSDFYGDASIIDDSIGDLRDSSVHDAFAYDISSIIVKASN